MLKITSKQLEVTAPILERIEGQFEKLTRHDIQLINPHVIITQEKQSFKIESSVGLPSGELFAQAKNENLYAAITAMGKKLEKQLNRLTHKPQSQRHVSPTAETNNDFEYDYKEETAA
ncbi:ribosome-associated translation inhibitor RaiA [Shewanella sp. 1_MG-2023]|uniref:Ribosome-associated translation inhibitor RaiA n=1 Tax=Shewanella electrodiphila TaxID=934143 RepID=A0ABT0KJN5_9GAMM|nr:MULTISPECIES: ribosome-associated translation inhibitor RaiA [Shewanella]MCC4831193.1 ribosome-associated translation inhibitor RaiA [Shewanella sp. 10N.7]MCL1044046.1 ribosome-associated translation inhibitor RaiA [Shewanella electrodiphila]MDO6610031.1 ribosome-associated translation inhibitor RaiA [Shewanella sp. 7_MG-2023]MDO6769827.1 ribosome-associated translation inhibitor RaiA [Shewanella sp. 2_MG-2023]MDO6792891.1 ribosome-associated translation inhibitor RaiA [Shewanella sp. 1_MG-